MTKPWTRASVAVAAALLLLCCRGTEGEQEKSDRNSVEAPPEPAAPVVVPVPQPPLDRRALLLAAFEAASAAATGADEGKQGKDLDGARFEFRIRFGCGEPLAKLAPGDTGWSFDAQSHTLRVQAAADLSLSDPLVASTAGKDFEAVEGVWIRRPWLLEPVCHPSQSEAALQSQSPAWRVGIAQFYTSTDPRTERRRNRPFLAVRKLAEDEPAPSQGFDLIVSGSLRRLPGRKAIACSGEASDAPASCLISAGFGRIWIERADTHETLAEWGGG